MAFGSVSAWTAYNELPVLDLLCFDIIVSRLETVLGLDLFSENDDASFPVNLGEFIRFHDNSVQ